MKETCTFKPDLSRTNNKYKQSAQSTYFSTAATQVLTHSATSDSRLRLQTNNAQQTTSMSRTASGGLESATPVLINKTPPK